MESSRRRRKRQLRRFIRILLCGIAAIALLAGCTSEKKAPQVGADAAKVSAEGAQRETMRRMIEAADGAYDSVNSKDLETARTKMAQLSVLSTKLSYDGIATTEGMEALTRSILDAMRAMNSVSPDERTVLQKVAAARLAVDSLAHREQPMWKEFRNGLEDDLDALEAAAKNRDDPAASRALAQWRGHVELILPALVIAKGAEAGSMLESMTTFLRNAIRAADWSGLLEGIPPVREALEDLFGTSHKETASPLIPTAEPPQPALWSLSLGSFILAVLTYVGWRKYIAETVVPIKRQRNSSLRK